MRTFSFTVSREKIMIDWFFEPASNLVVILGFTFVFLFLWSKDHVDRDRFKYIARALVKDGLGE